MKARAVAKYIKGSPQKARLVIDLIRGRNVNEALAVLAADSSIAILLTDLGLPGMNGRQLVEEALRRRPDLKVVIASGYSTEGEESQALKGRAAYLSKPFDLAQLRQALVG